MTEYVLIDHARDTRPFASYGPRFETCQVTPTGGGAREIDAPAAEVLAWLWANGITSRRRNVFKHAFDLTPNQEVKFRLRWG
ncbi:hypothetical protein [Methylobacterium sp. 13MFTsu3.1M2]|uniref:hypothetical protein n=1 Tax=Methylobacterium sp. 13MFTsu3.1M2 TaxID=1502776 RepID=UPI0008EBDB54|nr:hypothetical protein [Methylobacterium sp. 13MFTsu3.1M2]SFE91921.1 hypothetical protein SAMN02799627_04717 [Methylobacterium sp. 13MFTsu3.1M2]